MPLLIKLVLVSLVIGSLVLLVVLGATWRTSSGIWTVVLAALNLAVLGLTTCLVITLFPELVDARFRAYRSFYHELQPGMTREEIMATLDRYYPAQGPRKRPKVFASQAEGPGHELEFFMDPEHAAEPNCEGIFLEFENGRLAGKVYSAD